MAAFDKKVGAFLQPLFIHHEAIGVRHFRDACNNAESPLCRNPEDFSFWRLGTFDDNTGKFTPEETVTGTRCVAEAVNMKRQHYPEAPALPLGNHPTNTEKN